MWYKCITLIYDININFMPSLNIDSTFRLFAQVLDGVDAVWARQSIQDFGESILTL